MCCTFLGYKDLSLPLPLSFYQSLFRGGKKWERRRSIYFLQDSSSPLLSSPSFLFNNDPPLPLLPPPLIYLGETFSESLKVALQSDGEEEGGGGGGGGRGGFKRKRRQTTFTPSSSSLVSTRATARERETETCDSLFQMDFPNLRGHMWHACAFGADAHTPGAKFGPRGAADGY